MKKIAGNSGSNLFLLLLLTGTFVFFPQVTAATKEQKDFEEWIQFQQWQSRDRLFRNISPEGTQKGVVIASPSRDPNYFFHWVRDAAIVMQYVQHNNHHGKFNEELRNYISFAREIQRSDAPTGLGEPKFHVDGRPYRKPWGRPQNDGPALRAITMIQEAHRLLDSGNQKFVRNQLYSGDLPPETVIKKDLEYIAHHWQNPSYDLWEEVKGDHFYTRFVQQSALKMGAKLARRLDDTKAASFYREQARLLQTKLQQHWDRQQGHWRATLHYREGVDYKQSGLDTSILLAYLHTPNRDDFGRITDPKLIATVEALRSRFDTIYPINDRDYPATLIGRYPEDRFLGGNPWVLTTLSFAEFHYELAQALQRQGRLTLSEENTSFYKRILSTHTERDRSALDGTSTISTNQPLFNDLVQAVIQEGEAYFRRIRIHARPDGSLSEQLHKKHGRMLGAENLTWSYAAFLTAYRARQKMMD